MSTNVASQARPQSVLIVDDEASLRKLLVEALELKGYDVTAVGSGAAAIETLSKTSFDAVVLDIHMQPINGWEVMDFLRDSGNDPLLIILSGQVDVARAVSAFRVGAFDVLRKPCTFSEICERIRSGLDARLPAPRDGQDSEGVHRRSSGRIRLPAPPRLRGAARLIGDSQAIEEARAQIVNLARFRDVPALILGETGTGKEVAATAIHEESSPGSPFVSINCAAIPENLFESELFGHEAGAFTGARSTKAGLLETAGSGTLFLDEVGEMPLALQAKLLRVLQEKKFRRVGGKREYPFQARVISATNRRLSGKPDEAIRSDLYFRLARFTLSLPPLRERREDIERLALHFLVRFSGKYPGLPTRFHAQAMEVLHRYDFPGNVRELQLVIERAAIHSATGEISGLSVTQALDELPEGDEVWSTSTGYPSAFDEGADRGIPIQDGENPVDLNALQRKLTIDRFRQFDGNLAQTARSLGIPRTTLRDRLRRYGELE